MKTPCVVSDQNIYLKNKNDCPLILRSACLRGGTPRPPGSKLANNYKHLYRGAVDSSNVGTSGESHFRSLIRTTKSVWKKTFYSSQKQELDNYDDFVSDDDDDNVMNHGCCGHSHGALEKTDYNENYNKLTVDKSASTSSKNMSRTERFDGFSRLHLNQLSCSETEDDSSSVSDVRTRTKKRTKQNSHNSHSEAVSSTKVRSRNSASRSSTSNSSSKALNIAVGQESSEAVEGMSKHNSYFRTPVGVIGNSAFNQRFLSTDSSQNDLSAYQSTISGQLRWRIWRHVYLFLVRWISFDIWILSKVHYYGRSRICLLLLLPILLYLLSSSGPSDILSTSCDFITSKLTAIFSCICTLPSYLFSQKEHLPVDKSSQIISSPTIYTVLPSFSGISAFFAKFFTKTEESTVVFSTSSSSSPQHLPLKEPSYSTDELQLLVTKMIEEKFNSLASKLQMSSQIEKENEDDKLKREILDLHSHFQSLSRIIKEFEIDLGRLKSSPHAKNIEDLKLEHSVNVNLFSAKLESFEQKIEEIESIKESLVASIQLLFNENIMKAFQTVVKEDKNIDSSYFFFNQWLDGKFADSENAFQKLKIELDKFKKEMEADISRNHEKRGKHFESFVERLIDAKFHSIDITKIYSSEMISDSHIKKLIKESLMLYDADKTGLVDYALESGGGSIVGTRCSENYVQKNGKLTILGVPIFWYEHNSPRRAIQPSTQPGDCWAVKGNQLYLVVHLSYAIHPTGFHIEHIPPSVSPSLSIDSAPKDFSVFGLDSEKENEGTFLGSYTFDKEGEPLQYFAVENQKLGPFSFVELKVHSNHGNLEYTCLYRFRVHGDHPK